MKFASSLFGLVAVFSLVSGFAHANDDQECSYSALTKVCTIEHEPGGINVNVSVELYNKDGVKVNSVILVRSLARSEALKLLDSKACN